MDRSYFVYVIQAGQENLCKIGFSKQPGKRLSGLQTGNHRKLRLVLRVGPFAKDDAISLEKGIHAHLNNYRRLGEWFEISAVAAGYVVGMCAYGEYIQRPIPYSYSMSVADAA